MNLRRRLRERGAAAVEFALVLPLLVLIFGGIVDLGRAFMDQILLTNAAREGTRYAMVEADPSTAAAKSAIEARAEAAAGLDPTASASIDPNFEYNCATTGQMKVTVTHTQFQWLFLAVLPGLNNPQSLTGTSVIGCV